MDFFTAFAGAGMLLVALVVGGLVLWIAAEIFKAWRVSRRRPPIDEKIRAELLRAGYSDEEAEAAMRDSADSK
jgi:hypothetical protein